MLIIPAIDLIDGHCVRLMQGDYDRETRYDADPEALARQYADAGSPWLHVVDLDGARVGSQNNRQIVARLAAIDGLKVQCGGGVRSEEDVEALLDLGVGRVVVGSLAVKEPDRVRQWMEKWGGHRIVLALDVRWVETEFRVCVSGWTTTAEVSLWNALGRYKGADLQHVLCTDVERDGMMSGPNLMLYREMVDRMPKLSIQASGGVRHADDIKQLRQTHVASAIVGKALLDGNLALDALKPDPVRRR